jgi:hypothetical protein
MADLSPLLGEERKSDFAAVRSVDDPIPEVARTVAAMSQLGRKNIAKTYMALSPR